MFKQTDYKIFGYLINATVLRIKRTSSVIFGVKLWGLHSVKDCYPMLFQDDILVVGATSSQLQWVCQSPNLAI